MLQESLISYPKLITSVKVPPIKTQGIKTKLVKFIDTNISWSGKGKWIEPFLGSGVVMFNLEPKRVLATDSNMHIINFYKGIQKGKITPEKVKQYLEFEGNNLLKKGEEHYYNIRKRFNDNGDSLDFLFLSRACFNGVMRFNSKGRHNVPFCRKPTRFTKAYITKITNQVKWLHDLMKEKEWTFETADWRTSLAKSKKEDFIYLDPPYFGRHTDYYNQWSESDLQDLAMILKKSPCGFALSLWLQNKYRTNEYVEKLFSEFTIKTMEHFYHVGSSENLRNSMIEALIIKQGI